MVSLKNTIYLFLFGDAMEEKPKKIKVEDLGVLKSRYMEALDLAERKKRPYQTVGGKLMAIFSKKAKKTIIESDSIINEMKRGLQQIEKRRNEIAKLRQKKEIEKAQTEANVRKVMVRMEREHAELQRQQQRAREMQEKWDRTGTDFGATRLIKRRKR